MNKTVKWNRFGIKTSHSENDDLNEHIVCKTDACKTLEGTHDISHTFIVTTVVGILILLLLAVLSYLWWKRFKHQKGHDNHKKYMVEARNEDDAVQGHDHHQKNMVEARNDEDAVQGHDHHQKNMVEARNNEDAVQGHDHHQKNMVEARNDEDAVQGHDHHQKNMVEARNDEDAVQGHDHHQKNMVEARNDEDAVQGHDHHQKNMVEPRNDEDAVQGHDHHQKNMVEARNDEDAVQGHDHHQKNMVEARNDEDVVQGHDHHQKNMVEARNDERAVQGHDHHQKNTVEARNDEDAVQGHDHHQKNMVEARNDEDAVQGEETTVAEKENVTDCYGNQSGGPDFLPKSESILKKGNSVENIGAGHDEKLQDLLDKYSQVREKRMTTLEAKILVNENAEPKFYKSKKINHNMQLTIGGVLDSLEKEGKIEKVECSEWATRIVSDESGKIYGEYKLTINQVSKLDNYPISISNNLCETLSGGKSFSRLQLSQDYDELLLDEDSKQYVTINTHKGLFRYKHLPKGVSFGRRIYQRTMENLLQGIPSVVVRVQYIFVTGRNQSEHLANLNNVLIKLHESGMRLKMCKCTFLEPKVVYLGHRIDEHGIHPVENEVKAISDAPEPNNVNELKLYLNMINYSSEDDLFSKYSPLGVLLCQNRQWKWEKPQQEAFQLLKKQSKSSKLLLHNDPQKEIILSYKVSKNEIESFLSHRMENECERPVWCISRPFTVFERNYCDLGKEGLAIQFALKTFHDYLFDKKFTINSGNSALIKFIGAKKFIPIQTVDPMTDCALTLSEYEYEIV